MGLRLSQKFVFLLFLSGLVTLCFGALFFLPDSVRLKRIFLSKTDTQPVTVGSGSENDAREHMKRPRDPEQLQQQQQGIMTPGKGGETSSTKLKSRKASVSREGGETAAKVPEDPGLTRSRAEPRPDPGGDAEGNSDILSYNKFKRCLLKPPLGRDSGTPQDPRTNERREKVKEVRGA